MLSKSLGALAIVLGLGLVGAAYYTGVGHHGNCPFSSCDQSVAAPCCSEEVEACPSTCTESASECCQLKAAAAKASPCCSEKAEVAATEGKPAAQPVAAAAEKTP